jgi:hypothetical protein
MGPPLRATFSPAHPLARRDVPFAQARPFRFSKEWPRLPFTARIERAHFYCALCEQEGHLAAPSPSFRGRALREHRGLTGLSLSLLADFFSILQESLVA